MTCIVGLVENGIVYVGGDSAASDTDAVDVIINPKVFRNGDFLIGYTTSFRMGQLLQYKFSPPEHNRAEDTDIAYLITCFIDEVKKCFFDNSFGERGKGGTFLVGYNGNLYMVQSDFQVQQYAQDFCAIGCGENWAIGALYVTKGQNPRSRVVLALETASTFSNAVRPPFTVLEM